MERDREYLAQLDTVDNGKPFSTALEDIDASVGVLRYYAGWCDKIHGETIPSNGSYQICAIHLLKKTLYFS